MKEYLNEHNYKKAADSFAQAFKIDPTYSQAAYYLARTYDALFDQENADLYFKKAIQIDTDYMEARTNYAGMLLDRLDVDSAIRQLTTVLQREPNNAVANRHLAQAYRLKGLYPRAIEAAQKAILYAPSEGEPHLWLGDSLRLTDRDNEAEVEYEKYLKLTNFDPTIGNQLNYYVLGSLIGFGPFGRKHHAATRDIWKDLRSLSYFGLCDSERKLKRYDTAIAFCQKALSYSPDDAYAHYALGLSYVRKGEADQSVAEMDPALKHLRQVIAINPDLIEAKYAKTIIATVEAAVAQYQKALQSN